MQKIQLSHMVTKKSCLYLVSRSKQTFKKSLNSHHYSEFCVNAPSPDSQGCLKWGSHLF